MNRDADRSIEGSRADLARVYEQMPDVGCKGLCQDGCYSIGTFPVERQVVEAVHGIRLPAMAAHRCEALGDDGRCSIYEDRPLICRSFGAVQGILCPFGCEPADGLRSNAWFGMLAKRVAQIGRSEPTPGAGHGVVFHAGVPGRKAAGSR